MNNKLYQKACNNILGDLYENIGEIKALSHRTPEFSKSIPVFKRTPSGYCPEGTCGVYKMIYKPTMEVVAIGQGNNVAGRIGRHRLVFKNKGRDTTNPGGTTNPSTTGQKMYKYDTRKSNWLWSYIEIGNKLLALKVEKVLDAVYKPIFNNRGNA